MSVVTPTSEMIPNCTPTSAASEELDGIRYHLQPRLLAAGEQAADPQLGGSKFVMRTGQAPGMSVTTGTD